MEKPLTGLAVRVLNTLQRNRREGAVVPVVAVEESAEAILSATISLAS